MKTYRPSSWSAQARELANKMFEQLLYYRYEFSGSEYPEDAEYYAKCATKQHYIEFFSNSYRHPIIRQRAAKHFGKLCRKANIYE